MKSSYRFSGMGDFIKGLLIFHLHQSSISVTFIVRCTKMTRNSTPQTLLSVHLSIRTVETKIKMENHVREIVHVATRLDVLQFLKVLASTFLFVDPAHVLSLQLLQVFLVNILLHVTALQVADGSPVIDCHLRFGKPVHRP